MTKQAFEQKLQGNGASFAPGERPPFRHSSAPAPAPAPVHVNGSKPESLCSTIAPAALADSHSLLTEWEALAERLGAPPYMHPGWTEAWWRNFGRGTLDIHTVRRAGRLVGLLPMVRSRGLLTAAVNVHTPGFEPLTEDDDASFMLWRSIFSSKPRRVSLHYLDTVDDSLRVCRCTAENEGYRVVELPHQCSPYIELSESWEEYQAGLSAKLRKNVRRARRHLSRIGGAVMEITDGARRLEEQLAEAYGVEASGWKGERGTAIVSQELTRDFYTDIARWAAGRKIFRLFVLRAGGRALAMCYALEDHGVCHLLKLGYDPAYGHYSPGKVLLHDLIRHCFSAGLQRIEFHGDAEPFKFCWARAVRERKRLEAFAPSMTGRTAWAGFAYARPIALRALAGRRDPS